MPQYINQQNFIILSRKISVGIYIYIYIYSSEEYYCTLLCTYYIRVMYYDAGQLMQVLVQHEFANVQHVVFMQAVVTPLGALFWSLFDTDDCGAFFWGPHANSLTYFSIPGLLLMVPAIFIYNLMWVSLQR